MKKLKPQMQVALLILGLVLTNVLTGLIVYHQDQKEYDAFKARTLTVVDQKVAIQNAYDELSKLCPDEAKEVESALE